MHPELLDFLRGIRLGADVRDAAARKELHARVPGLAELEQGGHGLGIQADRQRELLVLIRHGRQALHAGLLDLKKLGLEQLHDGSQPAVRLDSVLLAVDLAALGQDARGDARRELVLERKQVDQEVDRRVREGRQGVRPGRLEEEPHRAGCRGDEPGVAAPEQRRQVRHRPALYHGLRPHLQPTGEAPQRRGRLNDQVGRRRVEVGWVGERVPEDLRHRLHRSLPDEGELFRPVSDNLVSY